MDLGDREMTQEEFEERLSAFPVVRSSSWNGFAQGDEEEADTVSKMEPSSLTNVPSEGGFKVRCQAALDEVLAEPEDGLVVWAVLKGVCKQWIHGMSDDDRDRLRTWLNQEDDEL